MTDVIMTVATLMLSYSLIPQIIKSYKENKVEITWQTVIITTIALWILVYGFSQLNIIFNTIANVLTATGWTILLVLKIKTEGWL